MTSKVKGQGHMVYMTGVGYTTKYVLGTLTKYTKTRTTDNRSDLQSQRSRS